MLPINTDSDGDGLLNTAEWFEHGTDSANPDSDGDGIDDGAEIAAGTSPVNAGTFPGDGDINEDSTTNLGDLVLLYRMVMGTLTPTPAQLARADMNQDGQLNAADILLLQQQLLQSWLGVGAPSSGAIAQRGPTWLQASASPLLDWLITPTHAVPANSGVLYYVHNDPLGTPQALTDENGAVVWTASYDPFGKAAINDDPDEDANAVTLNVRFPGQYYDQETGLHYNYFRYYDPLTGRYLTSDPIGLLGGLNTYGYVGGNPITRIDPTGEFGLAGAGTGFISGFVGGTVAGGNLKSGLIGGIAGATVGFFNPFASRAAGAFAGNFIASLAGQAAGVASNCKRKPRLDEIDPLVAGGAGIGGLGGRGLGGLIQSSRSNRLTPGKLGPRRPGVDSVFNSIFEGLGVGIGEGAFLGDSSRQCGCN